MRTFKKATLTDASAIVQLVNMAYRGESSRAGWTNEADLLDGLRTTLDEITHLIAAHNTIILLCWNAHTLLASICLELVNHTMQVGMFVVNPALQANGIGKELLAEAEKLAQQTWAVARFQMRVITLRHELIAFYVRRCYVRTGMVQAFPVNPAIWQPKRADLQLEILEKNITQ